MTRMLWRASSSAAAAKSLILLAYRDRASDVVPLRRSVARGHEAAKDRKCVHLVKECTTGSNASSPSAGESEDKLTAGHTALAGTGERGVTSRFGGNSIDAREQFLIGGDWVPAADAEFKTYNPPSGESLGIVAEAGQADVDAAARAVVDAASTWGGRTTALMTAEKDCRRDAMARATGPGPVRRTTVRCRWSVAAMLLLLAGCTSTSKAPHPLSSSAAQTASASPSPSIPADQAEAETKALAAYNAYREYQVKAMTSGHYEEKVMKGFIGSPELNIMIHALFVQESDGVTFTGRPTWSPTVASVNLTSTPPIVVIHDCFDVSGFTPLVQGKPVTTPSDVKRQDITVQVEQVSGKWYVFQAKTAAGTKC
jgi:hypothetical protein